MAKPPLRSLLATPSAQLILTSYRLTAVPEVVRDWPALCHLGLQRNQLRTLPAWIGACASLTSLYLGDNPLEALPDSLGALPALERLQLDGSALPALPEGLAQSPLRALHLDRMASLDWAQAFAVLSRCPQLTSLTLNGNPGIAAHLEGLRGLTSLRQVFLSACALEAAPAVLAEVPGLLEVSLVDNPLDRVPDALVTAPSLRMLLLDKTGVPAGERRRIRALRPDLRLG
ncbi:MAG: leucine-rich repeat domain-containing protein [Polyangiales bacterium]